MCYKLETVELQNGFPLSIQDCVCLDACEQLESIKISLCESSTTNIKTLTFKNKKMLKFLEVFHGCPGDLLLELGTNCPLLEHFKIDYLNCTTAMHVEVFTQSCTKLKSFELCDFLNFAPPTSRFSPGLQNKLMDGLGKNCPLLKKLTMTF